MQKPFDLTKFRTGLTKSITGISAGFHDPRDWISTGNKTLDYLISGDFNGGIPLGKVSVFAGESVLVNHLYVLETLLKMHKIKAVR